MMHFVRIRIKTSVAILVTVTALAACSSMSVTSDWDPEFDFSKIKTFAILVDEKPSTNRLVDQRIRKSITVELIAKGFKQAESIDEADMAFGFHVTTEERTSFSTVYTGWGSYGYRHSRYGNWNAPMGASTTTQYNYTMGTLIIAAFEKLNKELVWEGSGRDIVNPSNNPERNQQRTNDAIQRILRSFPPQGK